MTPPAPPPRSPLRAVPRGVWVLGLGSFFMDASSEAIHSLLPVFMVTVLGASAVSVGLIEGVAEGTAAITKVFSGALSDYFRNRKRLLVLGYALAALTKPLFPLAGGLGPVFTARFLDRVGKGIRGAPRDALVADITPPRLRGAAYGLRQALDAFGALTGPLLALALMAIFLGDMRSVFWVAVIPAFIAVALLWGGVQEPPRSEGRAAFQRPSFRDVRRFGGAFWWVVAVGGALTLARFSEAFLVLRAGNVGFALAHIPLVMVVMSLTYALSAYPAGALMDRFGFRPVLASSLGALLLANLALALAATPAAALAGAALWGLHMGSSQGVLAAMVAASAPEGLRASAFGAFNLVSGVLLFAASAIAGLLWEAIGPGTPFVAGAAFTLLSLGMLLRGRKIPVSGP